MVERRGGETVNEAPTQAPLPVVEHLRLEIRGWKQKIERFQRDLDHHRAQVESLGTLITAARLTIADYQEAVERLEYAGPKEQTQR
jgi:hypothetical protein